MTRSPDVRDVARALRSAARRLDEARGAAPGSASGGTHDPASNAMFLRGLVAGALVGAAIAGSTIWERHRTRQRIQRELGPIGDDAAD